jgi:hypothetical protein
MKVENHGVIIGMDSKHRSKDHYITLYTKRHQSFIVQIHSERLILPLGGQSSMPRVWGYHDIFHETHWSLLERKGLDNIFMFSLHNMIT